MAIARSETLRQAVLTARPREADDAAVIERSLRDPEAFAALFDEYAPQIHRYVARRLGAAVADDLLGETFARAFQHRRRYDLSQPDARPWLYGIATNLVSDHRRSETRRLRAMSRAAQPEDAEPMSERIDARLTAGAAKVGLAGALAQLPARQRDVVLLHAWAELDYEQIAEALAIPIGTVRSRLHRARRNLRAAIASHVTGDEGEPWTS